MSPLRSSALYVAVALLLALVAASTTIDAGEPAYTDRFQLSQCTFTSTGSTRYMILEPGYRLVLEGLDDGDEVRLVITVLHETISIQGMEARVVEERETKNEVLVEVSRNYFAICEQTGSVYYGGEDVDIYHEDGTVTHEGAWRHAVAGARAGLMMPGLPLLGARYFQEIAPGVALDRAEIVSLSVAMQTPAGFFEHCLLARETNPLEPGEEEFKLYAPGVGLIQDETLELTSYGFN